MALDLHSQHEEQDLPGLGPGKQMHGLSSMLGQEREECHISETLDPITAAPAVVQIL